MPGRNIESRESTGTFGNAGAGIMQDSGYQPSVMKPNKPSGIGMDRGFAF